MPRQIPLIVLTLTAALTLTLVSPGLNAASRVYKWTDADGVRHYSQTEPENIKAEVRNFDNGAMVEETAKPKTQNEIACERAHLSLDMLAESKPLTMDKDGDGKTEPMTADDRAAAKTLAERQVSAYCSPDSNSTAAK